MPWSKTLKAVRERGKGEVELSKEGWRVKGDGEETARALLD